MTTDELGSKESKDSKERALKILGNRSLSAREVEKRLIAKGDSQTVAEQTVEWLKDIRMIDDNEYAASIVKYYSTKGYGTARIKDELFKRGIERELWDEALEKIDNAEDAAIDYLEKKLKGDTSKDALRRAESNLCRRGFSYAEARAAIKNYLERIT